MTPETRAALLAFMESRAMAPPQVRRQGKHGTAKKSQRSTKSMPTRGFREAAGVGRKGGGWTAKLCVSPHLYVCSRCFATPLLAGRMLKVLRRARDLASSTEGLVRKALADACHEQSTELEELAPSFFAYVDATKLIGSAVCSRSSTCLDEAIHHRNLLLAGRAGGWSHFREAWLHVLQSPVQQRTSRAWGRARSKPLERGHAEEIVDMARRSFELQRQQQVAIVRRKRLSEAVRAVEAILKCEGRKRAHRRGSSSASLRSFKRIQVSQA